MKKAYLFFYLPNNSPNQLEGGFLFLHTIYEYVLKEKELGKKHIWNSKIFYLKCYQILANLYVIIIFHLKIGTPGSVTYFCCEFRLLNFCYVLCGRSTVISRETQVKLGFFKSGVVAIGAADSFVEGELTSAL